MKSREGRYVQEQRALRLLFPPRVTHCIPKKKLVIKDSLGYAFNLNRLDRQLDLNRGLWQQIQTYGRRIIYNRNDFTLDTFRDVIGTAFYGSGDNLVVQNIARSLNIQLINE